MKTFFFALSCMLVAAHAAPPPVSKSKPAKDAPAETRQVQKQGATAILLGEVLRIAPGDELTGTISGKLFERYAKENQIQATEAEIDAHIRALDRFEKESLEERQRDTQVLEKELKSSQLSATERKEKEKKLAMNKRFLASEREDESWAKKNPGAHRKIEREIAEQVILIWKINQSLFKKYGGRVIFQQAGPEPVDAYRDFLKEREKKGDFRLLTKEAREKFWEYFTNDEMHSFFDESDGREAMSTPWWLKPMNQSR